MEPVRFATLFARENTLRDAGRRCTTVSVYFRSCMGCCGERDAGRALHGVGRQQSRASDVATSRKTEGFAEIFARPPLRGRGSRHCEFPQRSGAGRLVPGARALAPDAGHRGPEARGNEEVGGVDARAEAVEAGRARAVGGRGSAVRGLDLRLALALAPGAVRALQRSGLQAVGASAPPGLLSQRARIGASCAAQRASADSPCLRFRFGRIRDHAARYLHCVR